MSIGSDFDEDLNRRLPLPLAQLYRRAHNAKTPLDRHLTAYYLWEATLKLLAGTAIVAYADRQELEPELVDSLRNLARPALGHWWEFVRRLLPVLAEAGDPGFAAANELVLGRARDDLPRLAALDAAVREALGGEGRPARTVRLSELFDRLVRYRNREIGHGALGQRGGAHHSRTGRAMLDGVTELLLRLDVLAGRRLWYVDDVRRHASGRWLIERYALEGEAPRRVEPLNIPAAETTRLPLPERVYLSAEFATPGLLMLDPLVVYDAEDGDVMFLNGRTGTQRTNYLSYTSGATSERRDLEGERRALIARTLGAPVDAAALAHWSSAPAVEAAESASDDHDPLEDGAETTVAEPRTVGEFELLSELGRGSMGVVYRAWQPSLGRQVAVKRLIHVGDPRAEARFGREIHALGRVEHPNLVKIFTSGTDGDQWYYAMELVEGTTLASVSDLIQAKGSAASTLDADSWRESFGSACEASRRMEKPLSDLDGPNHERPLIERPPAPRTADRGYARLVAGLVRQVAEAAHTLHEAGVLHRDIKPGNIMVTAEGGQAVLMDLGLAQFADGVEGKLTRTRQFVGTLRYASPEQVLGSGVLDRRSDVYSLGVTLWELLTLRPMYDATDATPTFELEKKILFVDPPQLRRHHPGIARDLEAIVQKCLEKEPGRRYPSARALADDLGRYLEGQTVQARPVGPVRRAAKWARRRPSQAALVVLFGVFLPLFAGAGLWYWDMALRLKVEYFAAYTKRWGRPEGVGRVTAEQARHRGASLKLTSRGGKVLRADVVNGHGYPTTQHAITALIDSITGNDDETKRECSYEFVYDEAGRVDREIAYDGAGQVVWIFRYTANGMGHFTDDTGLPRPRAGSGAVYVGFKESDDGFMTEYWFLDHDGERRPDQDGAYGFRIDRDSRGLEGRFGVIDASGRPMVHKAGFAQVQRTYDEQGNVIEETFLDQEGRRTLYKDGYSRSRFAYDSNGNLVEEAYLGLDDKPAIVKDGFATVRFTYSERGDITEMSYFGTDGRPTPYKGGYFGFLASYDDRGNRMAETYVGVDGKPTLCEDGYARCTFRYDRFGNVTETAFFGTDGKPTPDRYGVARSTKRFDERGNEVERAAFGVDGKPTRFTDGTARWVTAFDERNHQVERAYFGPDGKPALHSDGNAVWKCRYDRRGNPVEHIYLGLDGKPVRIRGGYASVRHRYDERGNLTESEYLGPDGRPTLGKDGFARSVSQVDPRGNILEMTYFGTDGRPTLHKAGNASFKARYDDLGRRIEEAYFGLDGKPTTDSAGNARWTAHYDERGNRTEQAYFGVDGRLRVNAEGYARSVSRYDDRGNLIERVYYGADDRPTKCNEGYVKQVWKYDERGNRVNVAFFDAGDHLLRTLYGIAGWTSRFDAHSNEIERAFFGPDKKPARHSEGHARFVARYDDRGNRLETTYFDEDGRLTVWNDEAARVTQRHDEGGRETEVAYWSADGQPTRCKHGCARLTKKYDDRGNVIETAYFGPDGKPARYVDGYARLAARYDDRGNQLEARFYGADGNPVRQTEGFSSWTAAYDEHGRMIDKAFFGPDGKPTRNANGNARWTGRYDERNNQVESSYFDEHGALTMSAADHCARITARYDDRGNRIEAAYFGTDNHPVLSTEGAARYTFDFDLFGNMIEVACWGVDGTPVRNSHFGFARRVSSYDTNRNMIDCAYYGIKGELLTPRVTISEVFRGLQGERLGLKKNDIFVAYDGKPIENTPRFLCTRRREGSQDSPKILVVARGATRFEVSLSPGMIGAKLEDMIPRTDSKPGTDGGDDQGAQQ